jgi:hypothetical protein
MKWTPAGLLAWLFGWAVLWNFAPSAHAHVGNPNTVFEGRAGGYPVRVMIQAPPVVPGLATIDIRVLDPGADSVEVLPIHWRTGRKGAPTPDTATPVAGFPGRFRAELWFMVQGAYSIDVRVRGARGEGTLRVPVNSLALTAIGMPASLGWILAVLGSGLVALLVGTVRAAARESMLAPGEVTSPARVRAGRIGTVAGVMIAAAMVAGGARWWVSEDRHHRAKQLFKPTPSRVEVLEQTNGGRMLRLTLKSPGLDSFQPLVPDHGKLLHLFLMRGTTPEVLVHLHPVAVEAAVFECQLPPIPAGSYRVFADLTRESGLAETVTNRVEVSASTVGTAWRKTDPDDSWWQIETVTAGKVEVMGEDLVARWGVDEPVRANEPLVVQLELTRPSGEPAPLQSYMGMLGHAVIVEEHGSVFSHVHPAGTVSMAAQRQFLKREGADVDRGMADANCGDLTVLPAKVVESLGSEGKVRFPYAFPKAGNYTVWVQVKVAGQIRTAALRIVVGPGTETPLESLSRVIQKARVPCCLEVGVFANPGLCGWIRRGGT